MILHVYKGIICNIQKAGEICRFHCIYTADTVECTYYKERSPYFVIGNAKGYVHGTERGKEEMTAHGSFEV